MKKILEQRLLHVSEAVTNGVVVQADADFLLQILKVQGEVIEKLKGGLEDFDDFIYNFECDHKCQCCLNNKAKLPELK